jgi:hypothetical protein
MSPFHRLEHTYDPQDQDQDRLEQGSHQNPDRTHKNRLQHSYREQHNLSDVMESGSVDHGRVEPGRQDTSLEPALPQRLEHSFQELSENDQGRFEPYASRLEHSYEMEVEDGELKGGIFTKLSHSFNPDEVDAEDLKGCPKITLKTMWCSLNMTQTFPLCRNCRLSE